MHGFVHQEHGGDCTCSSLADGSKTSGSRTTSWPSSPENRRCRWERRGPGETSCIGSHLAGDQKIDLTPVVFVVSQAFVDLGLRNLRKAAGNDGIDALSILRQANHIVHTDAGSFDAMIGWPPRTLGSCRKKPANRKTGLHPTETENDPCARPWKPRPHCSTHPRDGRQDIRLEPPSCSNNRPVPVTRATTSRG